jgi:hypothetical protein
MLAMMITKFMAHILPVSPSPCRTGENNRRGAGETYSDYNFDPSAMSQVAAIAKFIQHTVRTSLLTKLAHSHTLAQNTVFKTKDILSNPLALSSQEATPRQQNMLNATAGQTDDNVSSAPKLWLSAVAKFPFQVLTAQKIYENLRTNLKDDHVQNRMTLQCPHAKAERQVHRQNCMFSVRKIVYSV